MLGKIDCNNMTKDTRGVLYCKLSGRQCNYEKGENNGMRCSAYSHKAKNMYEQFENRILQDMYTDAMQQNSKLKLENNLALFNYNEFDLIQIMVEQRIREETISYNEIKILNHILEVVKNELLKEF